MDADRPRVAVWRNAWLAGSETFVRDQVAAMRRWEPVRFGLRAVAEPLTPADRTLLGPSRHHELRLELTGSIGLRRRAAAFLRERQVRLVHAHFGLDATSARPVAARLGVPLVATCHGYDVTKLTRLPPPMGWEYRRRLRQAFDSAGALVAVSRFIAERMAALGADPDRIRILPIGIDTRGVRDTDPLPDPARRRGVAFVGRLVPKKGVTELLQTWGALPASLRAQHPLRIVGEGPLHAELAAAAAAVDGPVELLGYRSSAEVADVLARSAVYLQPSRTAADGDAEGFGMVYLEAALQGLPSVAYAHGGVTDAVSDGVTGLLAPEGDHAALHANLEQLLTDPALAGRLGAAGRHRVLTEFDVVTCTAALERLYDEVAGSR
ncbi:Glycosyltransferase involved in cell wall bisynthesis [Jatrophihabitans endophyticus]|uniref:Glycosyltransferase involved in cell wall bisynthesis n=1 Tax=Jatrophihabitans endophyticus TaxID=1206085 RepID=A0A1M5I225_9ACTN|nr:glycosyltransferase [Jatrophihabitans endophyticus]SHG22374.1 Glycosyltransferase involved in cell wall bisynthesis [Jatrophihabitans endophyticus]